MSEGIVITMQASTHQIIFFLLFLTHVLLARVQG